MKRIDIIYGGNAYSLGDRDPNEVREEIAVAIRAGWGWFRVNSGEGRTVPADLLISSGVDVAIIQVMDSNDDPGAD